jgi:hypothetical protein
MKIKAKMRNNLIFTERPAEDSKTFSRPFDLEFILFHFILNNANRMTAQRYDLRNVSKRQLVETGARGCLLL